MFRKASRPELSRSLIHREIRIAPPTIFGIQRVRHEELDLSGLAATGTATATLPAAAVTNSSGDELDGNNDGIAGNNYVYNFSQIAPTLSISGSHNAIPNASYTL